jgi:hypothetical protein
MMRLLLNGWYITLKIMCIHRSKDPLTCKRCNSPHKSVLTWREPSFSNILKYHEFPEEIQKEEVRRFEPETKKSNWKYIRLEILKRDKTCRACFKEEGLVVHHMDHSGDGGNHVNSNNSPENLITLCRSCHTTIHQRAYKRLGKQYLDQIGTSYNKTTIITSEAEQLELI